MSAGRRLFSRCFTARRKRAKAVKVILLLLPLVLLLAVTVYRLNPGPAVPAMAGPEKIQEFQSIISDRDIIFRRILGQVIPGLGQITAPQRSSAESGRAEDILTGTVSRLDPRDPWRIISTQIPYISELGYQPQVLVYKPQEAEGGSVETPRIIIPANTVPGADGGGIIIYHTHTTESFVPTSGKDFTDNLELTVARLGTELARILMEKYNIPVVHNTKIHDYNRDASYRVALGTLRELLEKHPDAALVVDLHRDGVAKVISTAQIGGQSVGRIMFIVGSRHSNWQENNRKAEYLHQVLEEIAPGLSRGVRVVPLVYNQHLHTGSLLVEVGGNENSLEEAVRAIPYLAEALARYYRGG